MEVNAGGRGSEEEPRSDRDHTRRQDAGEERRFGTSWARQLGSLIQSGRTPFAHFWRVYQQRKGIKSRPKGGLFPCALPDSLRDGSKRPRSARRAARWRRHKAAKDVTRLIFAASNFVALGRHRRCPRALPRAESAAHDTALTFVRLRALQFVKLMEAGGAIGSGRRGPALLTQLEQLSTWARTHRSGFDPYRQSCGAERLAKLDAGGSAVLPVVAERISLPAKGATCALHHWMPKRVAETYTDPGQLRVRGAVSSR